MPPRRSKRQQRLTPDDPNEDPNDTSPTKGSTTKQTRKLVDLPEDPDDDAHATSRPRTSTTSQGGLVAPVDTSLIAQRTAELTRLTSKETILQQRINGLQTRIDELNSDIRTYQNDLKDATLPDDQKTRREQWLTKAEAEKVEKEAKLEEALGDMKELNKEIKEANEKLAQAKQNQGNGSLLPSLRQLEWVELSSAISEYMFSLAQLCLASAKGVKESILPTMYTMMDESFRDTCSQMSHRNTVYLRSFNFGDPSQQTTFEFRQQLSFRLQTSPDVVRVIELPHSGSLGRGNIMSGDTIAPHRYWILQRHVIPIYLTILESLQLHFEKPGFFANLLTADDQTKAQHQKTTSECYSIYSRPLHPTDSKHQKLLSNLMAISDQPGTGKSELLKIAIIGGLMMEKKVLVSRADNELLTIICLNPEETKPSQVSTVALTKLPYTDYLSYYKRQMELALAKFGEDVVVVTDPLEYIDKDPKIISDVLQEWNFHLSDLATRYPRTMFYSAHSTPIITHPNQQKEIAACNPYRMQHDRHYYITFLGLEPTHRPLVEACQQLSKLLGQEAKYSKIIAQIPQFCLPSLRNVISFVDKYFKENNFVKFEHLELDASYVSKHQLQFTKTTPINQTGRIQSQRGYLDNSPTILVDSVNDVQPPPGDQIRAVAVTAFPAFIRSSVGHSYDYIRSLSYTRVSPLLWRKGYYSLAPPLMVPDHHEDAWYYLLEAPGAKFRGVEIKRCYNLHLFGVNQERRDWLASNITENLTLGHSTHVLRPTVLDPEKIDPKTLKPSIKELLDDNSSLSRGISGEIHRNTINGLDWLAQHLDPSLGATFVRLPQQANKFDFFLFHGVEAGICKVSAIQLSVSESGKDEQKHNDAKELYQDIFQALFDSHHPDLDPKIEFLFTHFHYQPDSVCPTEKVVEEQGKWLVRYNDSREGLIAMLHTPLPALRQSERKRK